jgi:hypothetical protein
MFKGQVVADDDEHLRPRAALIASLAGRRIVGWERDGDVVTVTTERKRPCRRRTTGRGWGASRG